MLGPRIIWSVVTEPTLLVLLGLTLLLAWPLGRRLARPRGLGVLFVVVLGALLAATTTTGAGRSVVFFQLGPVQAYLGQLADPGLLWTGLRGFGQTDERLANIGLRGGDFNDVIHNSAGAALGAVLASTYLASQGTV